MNVVTDYFVIFESAKSVSDLLDNLRQLQKRHVRDEKKSLKRDGLFADETSDYHSMHIELNFDLMDLWSYLKEPSKIHKLIDDGCYCFVVSRGPNESYFVVQPQWSSDRPRWEVVWSFAPPSTRMPRCEGWRCRKKESFRNPWYCTYQDLRCKFKHADCRDCLENAPY